MSTPPTTTKGYPIKFNGEVVGTVEDDVSGLTSDGDYKNFLQRIRLNEPKTAEMASAYAYRWCYYSLASKGDKLVFSQRALLLSEPDLQSLLSQARAKGWPI